MAGCTPCARRRKAAEKARLKALEEGKRAKAAARGEQAMSNLKIVMTGHGQGEVWLDGQKLKVCGVEFSAGVGRCNEVRLSLATDTVEIEGMGHLVEVTTFGDAGRRFVSDGPSPAGAPDPAES